MPVSTTKSFSSFLLKVRRWFSRHSMPRLRITCLHRPRKYIRGAVFLFVLISISLGWLIGWERWISCIWTSWARFGLTWITSRSSCFNSKRRCCSRKMSILCVLVVLLTHSSRALTSCRSFLTALWVLFFLLSPHDLTLWLGRCPRIIRSIN